MARKLLGVQWNYTDQLAHWLVAAEASYGGIVTQVPCNVSEVEVPAKVFKGPKVCSGGNRMLTRTRRGGECYATLIDAFAAVWEEAWANSTEEWQAMEIGSLTGIGVAVWSELFPGSSMHALDRQLSMLHGNTPSLLELGAFRNGMYRHHGFDQGADLHPETDALLEELSREQKKFFWIVDDASHLEEYTLNTFKYFHKHLASNGVYIMENLPPDA
eukprot:2403873-Amphidinium_carterae.1